MHRQPHSPYYRDRASEYDLCHDFPADEPLIDGLHAMQSHFLNNGLYIDIPVVRVMNTAHYIAAYMFSNECSGDQMEYDALAYDSFGRDKQLVPLTMIVLAAMLKRTEGFRARQCRNIILSDRSSTVPTSPHKSPPKPATSRTPPSATASSPSTPSRLR